MKNSREKIKRLCVAAVFGAIIFVATAFLPRIPIGNGYVHIGDAAVYICAALLPAGYALPACAIGASLADLASGYAVYVPATALIKAASALVFSHGKGELVSKRNLTACFAGAVFCVGGYFLWEALVFSSLAAPFASVIGNLLQSTASAVLFFAAAFAVDRSGLKNKL